jgi:hypothetical protein
VASRLAELERGYQPSEAFRGKRVEREVAQRELAALENAAVARPGQTMPRSDDASRKLRSVRGSRPPQAVTWLRIASGTSGIAPGREATNAP